MTKQEKIKLINAAIIVAEFWEVSPTDLLAFTAITRPEKKKEWNRIAQEVEEFGRMNIEDRLTELGFGLIPTASE